MLVMLGWSLVVSNSSQSVPNMELSVRKQNGTLAASEVEGKKSQIQDLLNLQIDTAAYTHGHWMTLAPV